MFRDIDAYSATLTGTQLGRRGEASPALFEVLIVSIFGLNLPFKI